MFLKILLGIWMAGVIVAAFLVTPPGGRDFLDPDSARIIIFHVPNAVVAVTAFFVAMLYAVKYLRGRDLRDDAKSAISAELGLVFAALAIVTGSLFARMQWGSWWNWDPRETGMVVLLLVYAAYFALRSAVDGADRRASLSAVYGIMAIAPMLFLTLVLPRVVFSLHPPTALAYPKAQRLVLVPAMLGFLGLYLWLFRIRTAVAEVRLKLKRY